MSEDKQPDWLAELTANAEALRRQIDDSGEALRRQVDQLVRGAEQFVRDVQRTVPGGGPVPSFQQRIVRAVGASMRELLPMSGYPVRYGSFRGSIIGVGTVTGSGSVALPPMRVVADGDVITFTETESVKVILDRSTGLAALTDGQIVFLVLVWLYAFMLPWFGAALPQEFHSVLNDFYGTFSLALSITCLVVTKNK
jgi:hypothetical protein